MSGERHMTEDADTEELKLRLICSDCVGETFLSDEIERSGHDGTCHYCDGVGKTFTLEQMADRISTAFGQHYQRTDPNPTGFEYTMMRDKESTYDWSRHGELVTDVIQETAEIDEQPAIDIQQILRDENAGDPTDWSGDEEELDDESHYEPKALDAEAWQREWSRFEHSLKTESRYFSEEARAHLTQCSTASLPCARKVALALSSRLVPKKSCRYTASIAHGRSNPGQSWRLL